MCPQIPANSGSSGRVQSFKRAVPMNPGDGFSASPLLFEVHQEAVIVTFPKVGKERITIVDLRQIGHERSLMGGCVRDNEPDAGGIGRVIEQHLLDKNSTQAVSNEHDFLVVPDSLPL
jgi:hypothetical protein